MYYKNWIPISLLFIIDTTLSQETKKAPDGLFWRTDGHGKRATDPVNTKMIDETYPPVTYKDGRWRVTDNHGKLATDASNVEVSGPYYLAKGGGLKVTDANKNTEAGTATYKWKVTEHGGGKYVTDAYRHPLTDVNGLLINSTYEPPKRDANNGVYVTDEHRKRVTDKSGVMQKSTYAPKKVTSITVSTRSTNSRKVTGITVSTGSTKKRKDGGSNTTKKGDKKDNTNKATKLTAKGGA